jgi:hypothetical protein
MGVQLKPEALGGREHLLNSLQEIGMRRSIGLIAILTLLSACKAPVPPIQHIAVGHQPGEEAAVLEALDRYVTAISENDLEAKAAMLMPEGMTYIWRPIYHVGEDGTWRRAEGGGMEIVARPNSYWIDPSRDDGRVRRERYWSPTVLIRGAIAVVWAPYEFWVNGETSHCGVDVFDFVKIDGTWLVSNSTWTVEHEACPELRPSDTSSLRPQD